MLSPKGKSIIFVGVVGLFFTHVVFAQIEISEIMFDASGADGGREWVEITNTSATPVTIATSTWKFFESSTNHNLALFQGSLTVAPGGFVIISDDPKKFLIDWPQYSGTIIDSAFSLNQTGETLVLKSSNTTVVDSVTYVGQKDFAEGNSLQKINGLWKSSKPTPGAPNHEEAPVIAPTLKPAVVPVVQSVKVSVPIKKTSSETSAPAPQVIPKENIKTLPVAVSSQVAEVSATSKSHDSPFSSYWLYALFGVIVLGVGGVLLPKSEREIPTVRTEADEYTIIE